MLSNWVLMGALAGTSLATETTGRDSGVAAWGPVAQQQIRITISVKPALQIRQFAPAKPPQWNSEGAAKYLCIWSNLPAQSYDIRIEDRAHLGTLERSFVDGAGECNEHDLQLNKHIVANERELDVITLIIVPR